jgi:hypothetical protein
MSLNDLNQVIKIPIEDIPFHNTPIYYVGILGILAWVTVALRIYTRTFILRSPGWDDYTMVVALVRHEANNDMRMLRHTGVFYGIWSRI